MKVKIINCNIICGTHSLRAIKGGTIAWVHNLNARKASSILSRIPEDGKPFPTCWVIKGDGQFKSNDWEIYKEIKYAEGKNNRS